MCEMGYGEFMIRLAQIVGILLYEQLFQPIFRLVGRIFLRISNPTNLVYHSHNYNNNS